MMSLPVPLSPWIRTGRFALAIFCTRSRTNSMARVVPKRIDSGGTGDDRSVVKAVPATDIVVPLFLNAASRTLFALYTPNFATTLVWHTTAVRNRIEYPVTVFQQLTRYMNLSARGEDMKKRKKFSYAEAIFPFAVSWSGR